MKPQNFLGTGKYEEAEEIRILGIPIYRKGRITKVYPSFDYDRVIADGCMVIDKLGSVINEDADKQKV